MEVWGQRGSRRGRGGESKIHEADKRRLWTVARAASVSGVYVIHMYCTYIGESLLEVLQGLAKPGGGRREVSHWRLNDALKHEIDLPSGTREVLEALEVRPWKCGGSEEAGEEGGRSRSYKATRGLRPELQASAVCVGILYNVHTPVATWSGQADPLWARTSFFF